jgi:HD-GYP domain-containing protein (c-di-GMP phosphodiesterase class II)
MAVANAFEAMVSERPYRKKAFTKEEAAVEIKKNSGTYFDPAVVEAFLRIVERI